MQITFLRLLPLLFCVCALPALAQQPDTTRPTSVDPELLNIENTRVPKEYTITGITVSGAQYLDTAIVASISGLQVGEKIQIPGSDAFAKAIQALWRQRLFANVQIFITSLTDDAIQIEIAVQELPKLADFQLKGIRKSEAEELSGKLGLVETSSSIKPMTSY